MQNQRKYYGLPLFQICSVRIYCLSSVLPSGLRSLSPKRYSLETANASGTTRERSCPLEAPDWALVQIP